MLEQRNASHFARTTKRFTLYKHEKICYKFETCQVLLPEPDSNSLAFKKFQAKAALPLVIYFDLESIIVPVSSVEQNPQTSGTRVLDKHIPSGYCYVAISQGSPNLEFFHLYRGEDCMQVFVKQLETLAKDIYEKKQKHRYFTGAVGQAREIASQCWICETNFSAENEKLLDHYHFSNQFLGWAHSKCNLQRKTQSFVPIIAHILSGYDLHHVVKSLHHCNPNNKFSKTPQTDENYISFSFKVWIKDIVTKNQNVIPRYEELRFIDSLRFMQSSLDKLVQSLPEDSFDILDNHFEYCDQNDVKLLHGKRFYPYSYLDTFRKFKLKKLPPKKCWVDKLKSGKVTITEDDYEKAKLIFEKFDCRHMGDYHDLYLTVDTLQLACWFERLRAVCLVQLGLCSISISTTLSGRRLSEDMSPRPGASHRSRPS